MSSIRTQVSKILHLDGDTALSHVHHEQDDADRSDSSSVSSSAVSVPSRALTPMLDPSTNMNPLQREKHGEHGEHGDKTDTVQQKNPLVPGDVSKHTFYVVNSQMKLKISARNEVNPVSGFHTIYSYFFFSEII